MYDSIDNLWSVLFTTGYLTQRGKSKENCFQLTIPNLEIRNIFTTQIMDFFKENVSKNGDALRTFCEAEENRRKTVFSLQFLIWRFAIFLQHKLWTFLKRMYQKMEML